MCPIKVSRNTFLLQFTLYQFSRPVFPGVTNQVDEADDKFIAKLLFSLGSEKRTTPSNVRLFTTFPHESLFFHCCE